MENLKPFVETLSNLPVPEPNGLDLIIAMGCEEPEDSQRRIIHCLQTFNQHVTDVYEVYAIAPTARENSGKHSTTIVSNCKLRHQYDVFRLNNVLTLGRCARWMKNQMIY